jgi:YjgF/chorismate_mutase-like, putative endoribonuclease
VGKVGRELDLVAGRRAARLCAINLFAALENACDGDLDRVRRFVMLRGFVNATEEFEDVPLVMNGASDLIVEVFGSAVGRHARTSIGCATLPGRVAVELDAVVSIEPG